MTKKVAEPFSALMMTFDDSGVTKADLNVLMYGRVVSLTGTFDETLSPSLSTGTSFRLDIFESDSPKTELIRETAVHYRTAETSWLAGDYFDKRMYPKAIMLSDVLALITEGSPSNDEFHSVTKLRLPTNIVTVELVSYYVSLRNSGLEHESIPGPTFFTAITLYDDLLLFFESWGYYRHYDLFKQHVLPSVVTQLPMDGATATLSNCHVYTEDSYRYLATS